MSTPHSLFLNEGNIMLALEEKTIGLEEIRTQTWKTTSDRAEVVETLILGGFNKQDLQYVKDGVFSGTRIKWECLIQCWASQVVIVQEPVSAEDSKRER